MIEAVACRLPRRMLRQLRNHPDVVAMSVDADVSPMSVAGLTGTAQGSAYSLRSTLGLDATTYTPTAIVTGATTRSKGTSVSSLSWSHTVAAGTNRILVVTTAHRDAAKSVSRVTYGGVNLAQSGCRAPTSNSAALYYLVNPPVGTATVLVTMSGAVTVAASATTFTGVDQVTPFSPGASRRGSEHNGLGLGDPSRWVK